MKKHKSIQTLIKPPIKTMTHSLIIKKSSTQPISAQAEEFNKLILKIERLKEKKLMKYGELDSCMDYYAREGFQTIKENTETRMTFVNLIFEIYNSELITLQKDKIALADLIFYQMSQIKIFYGLYVPKGYEEFKGKIISIEELKMNGEEIEQIAEMYKEQLDEMGIELDFDIEEWLQSGGSLDEMQERIKHKIYEAEKSNHFRNDSTKKVNTKTKPKSKKQLQVEEVEKNLNNLYRQLARVFHPDLETDESKKEHKQELMKELNNVYKEKNIFAMLQMELRWLAESSDRLVKLPEEKLKIFILSLKEQIKILNAEFNNIHNEARFQILQKVSFPYLCNSLIIFYGEINRITRETNDLDKTIKAIEKGNNKKVIKELLKEIHMASFSMPFGF